MDITELARQALAQREFTAQVGAGQTQRQITLRLPTHYESMLAATRAGAYSGDAKQDRLASQIKLQRELLIVAIVGWSGVQVCDVLGTDEADPLEYSADAVVLLLDAQPEWEAELGAELLAKLAARRLKKDTAAKN